MFHTTPHQKYDHNSEICQKSPDHNSAIRPDDISAVNIYTGPQPDPPIVYYDDQRLGFAVPLDRVHNDRHPDLGADNF